MVEKGSLNRLLPFVNFIDCDPLSDHSKSKAQTTKVQQIRPCLLIPIRKVELFPGRTDGRTSVFLHYRTERALRVKISHKG